MRDKIDKIEAVHLQVTTDFDERISTLEIIENTHYKSLFNRCNDLENRLEANEKETRKIEVRVSAWEERVKELDSVLTKTINDLDRTNESAVQQLHQPNTLNLIKKLKKDG